MLQSLSTLKAPIMNYLFLVIVCSFVFKAESQNTQTRRYYNNAPNVDSGQLYFTDNKPIGTRQENQNAKNVIRRDEERTTAADVSDSYLQAISNKDKNVYANQEYKNINANNNSNGQQFLTTPSINLQPPLQNNQDYYSTNINSVQRLSTDDSLRQGSESGQTSSQIADNFDQNDVSLSTTDFGLFLIKNLNQSPSTNAVVSPYSITILLALLQQGALGETQQQLTRVLQMTPEKTVAVYKMLSDTVKKRSTHRNILKVANNIFVADAFDLNPAFKRTAIRNFGSDITPTSFATPSLATQRINSWVADKTRNKIDKIVTTESVDDNTQLVLANAIYFKGLWQSQFKNEATLPRQFHLGSGATKTVPFMRMRRFFKAGYDMSNGAKVIILPFEREQYSLIVISPLEITNLQTVLSTLTSAQLLDYQKFTPKEVDLELPKFTVKSDTDLNPILRQLGITSIFGPQTELSGLGTYRAVSPQVSSALHSAVLSIDEQGGTAAAATAFAVVALSNDDASIVFKANRPFLAVLWDNEMNLPLFLARIEDPVL